MKKYGIWIISFFIIIVILVALWFLKEPIASTYLSYKLKTNVTISSINVSKNKILIKNFRIQNPKRVKEIYAFISKDITVNYSFSNLFSTPSVVDTITLYDVTLNIECANPLCSKNNWTDIAGNISKKEKSKPSSQEYIIRKLVMRDLNVSIEGLGLNFTQNKQTHISYLEFDNISSKKGFPTGQLIAAIFKSAGLKDYLKGFFDTKNMIETIIDTFKGIGENSLEETIKSY